MSWYDIDSLPAGEQKTNLLDELMLKFDEFDYVGSDVVWCNIEEVSVPWEEFVRLASHTDYYAGYGIVEIPQITIMMSDGRWFDRFAYDGLEQWVLNDKPTQAEVRSSTLELDNLRLKESDDIIEALPATIRETL